MTENRKELLIAKIIDAPDSLSDEELELIVGDDELRDILEMSAIVKGACMKPSEKNVADEWKRFRPRLTQSSRPSWGWAMRVAAIFLGVLFLSAIMVRLVDFMSSAPEKPFMANEEGTHVQEAVLTAPTVESEPETAIPVQTPESTSVGKASRTAKDKATDAPETTDIDIDEYLRIQQARIENEIAEQNAEIYLAEYQAMQQCSKDVYDNHSENFHDEACTEESNFIRKITMR